jgi:molybdate transport system substrate-binding protein
MNIYWKIPVLAWLLVLAPFSSAQTLRIAAASDLQFAMNDLGESFEKERGIKVAVTYGSSGIFFAQIQNGAPFDLFFSADTTFPKKLIEAGSADANSFVVYAYGRLVIWLPPDSPFDLTAAGFRTLLDPRIKRVAIANPEHAPYGRAAIIALRDAGIYDQVKSKLVLGENIAQAAQFVESGNAQVGIIAKSLALSPAMKSGKLWDISMVTKEIEQAAVVVRSSPNKQAAIEFLSFLRTAPARSTLERFGFTVLPLDPKAGIIK